MKNLIIVALLLGSTYTVCAGKDKKWATPLSQYSKEWDNPKYKTCNTAAKTRYLSDEAKEIIYILNMARMNPQLFCKTILIQNRQLTFCDTSNTYYKSLVETMMKMKPLALLNPDSLCYVSALCHVTSTGPTGFVGHDRQTKECQKVKHYSGECCTYGTGGALNVVVTLLVDKDVESLGHRGICLTGYNRIGIAEGPHKGYGNMKVLDFSYSIPAQL